MKKKPTALPPSTAALAKAWNADTRKSNGLLPKRSRKATPPASLPEQLAQIAKRGSKSGGLSDARIVPPAPAAPPPPPAPPAKSATDIAAARTSAAKQAWATRRADPNSAFNRNRAAKLAAEAAAKAEAEAAAKAAADAAAAAAAREAKAAAAKPTARKAAKPTARRTA